MTAGSRSALSGALPLRQASSSRCSAPAATAERAEFYPAKRSLHGAAKVYSHFATCNYREAYGLFAVNGILFITNHRGAVRRSHPKDHQAVARIKAGIQSEVAIS